MWDGVWCRACFRGESVDCVGSRCGHRPFVGWCYVDILVGRDTGGVARRMCLSARRCLSTVVEEMSFPPARGSTVVVAKWWWRPRGSCWGCVERGGEGGAGGYWWMSLAKVVPPSHVWKPQSDVGRVPMTRWCNGAVLMTVLWSFWVGRVA